MHLTRTQKIIAGSVALLAAAGGGAAIAASQNESPSEESQAIIDYAAAQLGIPSAKLSAALKKALSDRIDAAVASGRLTKEEGDTLKARIQSDEFPLFGGFHRGFGHFGGLDPAADSHGRITKERENEILSDVRERIRNLVNSKGLGHHPPFAGPGFGFRLRHVGEPFS